MTDRELMQMALDALEEIHPDNMTTIAEKSWSKAIEALRAVLAQPNEFNPDWDAVAVMVEEQQRMAKELKTQREWQGLTDEEREEATGWSVEHIEAKLKEKNT